jgi:hypothetical protein
MPSQSEQIWTFKLGQCFGSKLSITKTHISNTKDDKNEGTKKINGNVDKIEDNKT